MAKHISVRGAQPNTKDEEIESAHITITGCFPYSPIDSDSTINDDLKQLRGSFKKDAEKLFAILHSSLPGGTFCQLLVLMLQEKASHFIVSHKPTAEYQKMEAASEMFDALKKGDMLGNEGPFLLDYASNLVHHFAPNTAHELRRKAEVEREALTKVRGESGGKMTKHTPGPWRVYGLEIVSPARPSIALLHLKFGRWITDDPETVANAHLIARSPSMLALLEKALPIIQAEAEQRKHFPSEDEEAGNYWLDMCGLANEISAEIDRARGKGASDG